MAWIFPSVFQNVLFQTSTLIGWVVAMCTPLWFHPSVSYRWSTPMTQTPIHLTARPTCQGSSGGIIPAKRALSAMKILQTTIRHRGVLCGILQYDWDEVTAICMPSIDNIWPQFPSTLYIQICCETKQSSIGSCHFVANSKSAVVQTPTFIRSAFSQHSSADWNLVIEDPGWQRACQTSRLPFVSF